MKTSLAILAFGYDHETDDDFRGAVAMLVDYARVAGFRYMTAEEVAAVQGAEGIETVDEAIQSQRLH